MHALELSILLHRALEARVEYLTGLLAAPGWQEDPELLHQVRVGSRRLRAVLDLVRPELYPAFRRHERRLRRLTRALGLTREMDVHALYLEDLATKVPGLATASSLEHALEFLETGRSKARKRMARDLAGNPLKNLQDLLRVPSMPEPFLPGIWPRTSGRRWTRSWRAPSPPSRPPGQGGPPRAPRGQDPDQALPLRAGGPRRRLPRAPRRPAPAAQGAPDGPGRPP